MIAFSLQLTRNQTLPSSITIKFVTLIIRKVMDDSSHGNKFVFTINTYLIPHLCFLLLLHWNQLYNNSQKLPCQR